MSICRTVILPAAALLAVVTTTVPGAAQERYDLSLIHISEPTRPY